MKGQKTMECADAREKFPWWLNGSLDPEEQRQLALHLEGCDACRGELEEARLALATFANHLSIEVLIDYAAGRDPGVDQDLLETHLASCQDCAEELALLQESREAVERSAEGKVLTWPSPSSTFIGLPWRALAVAASLLAVVAGFIAVRGWQTVSTLQEHLADLHSAPPAVVQPNVAVVDLFPSELILRAGEVPEPATRVTASAVPTTLLLNSQLPSSSAPFVLEIVAANEERILTLTGLRPTSGGLLTLSLPTADLPAGELILHLSSEKAADRKPLESYRFQVR